MILRIECNQQRTARRIQIVSAVALLCLSCSFEEASPGVLSGCDESSLECAEAGISSSQEACWKLVTCGAIPVANPDTEELRNRFFDYPRCVSHFDGLAEPVFQVAISCVEDAACSQLQFPGSPSRPTRNREQMPACMQYGDS